MIKGIVLMVFAILTLSTSLNISPVQADVTDGVTFEADYRTAMARSSYTARRTAML